MAAMGAQYQEAMVLSAGRNKTQSQSATSKRNGNEMRAKWERNGGAISERNGSARERNRSAMGAKSYSHGVP